MLTFRVESNDQLIKALEEADGGDEILLAPTFDGYVTLTKDLHRIRFSDTLTIKSEDPDNPAHFSRFILRDAKNITLENIIFDYDARPNADQWVSPFRVRDSHGITIKNSVFDGDVASSSGPKNDGYATGYGLLVSGGGDVVIEDSLFHTWFRGASFGGVDGLRVSGNELTGMRSDGLTFSGVRNVVVENNYIHDFKASHGSDDHRDMIQFWTNGSSFRTSDVIIRNNFLDSGDGDPTQSIFMRNEEVDTGRAGLEMFYKNVLIEDNIIRNGHMHGIYVGEADGIEIVRNTVIQDDTANTYKSVNIPKIYVPYSAKNVSIIDNITGDYSESSKWNVKNNLIAQKWSESKPGYYGDLFVNAMLNGKATLADLQALPDGLVENMGVGAKATRFDPTPDDLTARPTLIYSDRDTLVFSGALSADSGGPLEGDATYSWDFGDGRTAHGLAVEHSYDTPGDYNVTLTVQTVDGEQSSGTVTARVSDPVLLKIDASGSSVDDLSSFDVRTKVKNISVQDSPEDRAFFLDGGDQIHIQRNDAPHLFDHDELTIGVKMKATAGRSSDGEIFNITNAFKVRVDSNGELNVAFRNDGGKWSNFKTNDADLLNGAWRDVAVVFDSEVGRMTLFVDGEELGGGDATGRTRPAENWNIQIGSTHKAGFIGLVESFEIRDAGLAEYKGATAQPGGNASAPPTPALVLEPEPAPEASVSSEYLDVYLAYADTDQVIAKLDGSPEIPANEIDGRPLAIYAVPKVGAPAIGSVRLDSGGLGHKVENIAPYALFGDHDGDLKGGLRLEEGDHAITLTAYSGSRGSGAELETTTFDFSVGEPAPVSDGLDSSEILDVYLAFADTDEIVGTIHDDAEFVLDDLGGREVTLYAVAKNGAPAIGSVRLEADGFGEKTESLSPYAMFGDHNGDLVPGVTLDEGDYALTLTSYAEAGGSGSILEAMTLDFSVL